MNARTLKNWKARRAGGAITVTGTDVQTGQQVRLAGIVDVQPRAGIKTGFFGLVRGNVPHVVATHSDGTEHVLSLAD